MDEMISRKEFLKMGAKAAMSLAVVTACGDLLSLSARSKVKIEKAKALPNDFLITVEELKKKAAVNFDYQGKKAILLYNNGEIRAFESKCTHKGGPLLSDGDKFVCKWHSATFNPLTGEALTSPAPKGSALKKIEIKIKEGGIYGV